MPLDAMTLGDEEMTLDPPGRIAVIGAGPLGIEAALYGRYLGYDVQVFEQGDIAAALRSQQGPIPMLPDRTMTTLAVGALQAIQPAGDPFRYPMTYPEWIADVCERICQFDLLRGRVHPFTRVVSIELVEVAAEALMLDEHDQRDQAYVDGDVPPDYRLTVTGMDPSQIDFEAVIVAIGRADSSSIPGLTDLLTTPYLFRVGAAMDETDEAALHRGWREITAIYARLGGRADLDLYRPFRM